MDSTKLKRDIGCCRDEDIRNPNELHQNKILKMDNEMLNNVANKSDDDHVDDNTTSEITSKDNLSKTQLKKLLKKEKWEKSKAYRRAKEKERLRQKRIEAKINNVSLGPSRKLLKNTKMATSSCKVSVVIDMSFDDLMDARSIGKCNKQMLHCYSLNRRTENPLQLYFTSLTGKSLAEMEKHDGYKNWDVHIKSEYFTEAFPIEKLVYLTSESENEVDKLEEDKVYIIGGLVDHNAYKGHCYEVAKKKGISHAQLPIGQYLDMKTRKVLTIDHVFAILLNVSKGASWKEAFLEVLPQRKGAKEKETESEDDTSKTSETNTAVEDKNSE